MAASNAAELIFSQKSLFLRVGVGIEFGCIFIFAIRVMFSFFVNRMLTAIDFNW